MITTMHDYLESTDDSEPEPIMDTCETCGLRLEPGEIQFCNRHEPSRYECPVCHGKGYIARSRSCRTGDCSNCDCRCAECMGDGWVLLSLEDAERRDARSIEEPRR